MNVDGQYNPKDVECISVENLEVLPSGADWQSRHLESERRKAEIRDRIHKQAEQGQKTAKDYFRPAKPTPSIYDSDLKRVAVYARVSTSSEEQISSIENQTLTQKKRSTLRGKQEWNGMMVANIMKNERRWGDLEARKSIVVDYKLGKVTKNNGNRCSAYVPEHHEAIVSPEIARAAHLVASSRKKCGVQDIVVIQQGALKGFVGIHPNWSGINAESIRSLCLSTYLPEEVMKLNDIAEMRAGATLGKALQSEYMTVSGACFINQSSPVMTISKNGIRFSKACHSRLDDCEYVELLYHPILQVVILRKSSFLC